VNRNKVVFGISTYTYLKDDGHLTQSKAVHLSPKLQQNMQTIYQYFSG